MHTSLTGKELVLQAVKGRATPRAPWVPFVGCHGGQLVGAPADEYLRSAELMTAGLLKAYESYRPDGLPVIFDLQVEAEILGCELHWSKDVPPSVCTHPLAGHLELSFTALNAFSTTAGRYPVVWQTLRNLRQYLGEQIALYGLICGPFTLALHLLGNDIFLEMHDRPVRVSELVNYCAAIARQAADGYLSNGADVIAVVDPMTSQISPAHFRQFVTPAVNGIFDHIRQQKGLSSLFVCGNVERNLEVMCATHCDNISVDEQIALPRLRKLALNNGKSFGGNLKLTVALLMGNEDDCRLEAIRNLDEGGDRGFILSPGCDIPYHVPPQNLIAVTEMVHDAYQRQIYKQTLTAKDLPFDHISLPDYRRLQEVVIDIVTLDSEACAPCQYMVEAAKKAAAGLTVKTIIREHKIKDEAGVAMMKKLNVTGLPTICLDGEVAFMSIIPDQPSLQAAILAKARAKQRSA